MAFHEHSFSQRPLPGDCPWGTNRGAETRKVGRQLMPEAWYKSFHCKGCGADLVRAHNPQGEQRRAIRFPNTDWMVLR